jgi:hypothetical protein
LHPKFYKPKFFLDVKFASNYIEMLKLAGISTNKVRSPIPQGYADFYIVYYKDIGEFQILYSQDICW